VKNKREFCVKKIKEKFDTSDFLYNIIQGAATSYVIKEVTLNIEKI
jgi:hypothetical protein